MGKAKKSRAVRVKFAQTKRLLSPKDCRLKGNQKKEETKRKKVRGWCVASEGWLVVSGGPNAMLCLLSAFNFQQQFLRCSLQSLSAWGHHQSPTHTREIRHTHGRYPGYICPVYL